MKSLGIKSLLLLINFKRFQYTAQYHAWVKRGGSNTEFAAQATGPGEGTAFELQINGGGRTGWIWDEKSCNSFEKMGSFQKLPIQNRKQARTRALSCTCTQVGLKISKKVISKDSWPPPLYRWGCLQLFASSARACSSETGVGMPPNQRQKPHIRCAVWIMTHRARPIYVLFVPFRFVY